ncbi:MAG: hypothetical protein ACYC6G_20065 [Desulfobaccales bacterium]
MSFERLKLESRLTVLETQVVRERLRLEGLRDSLRDLLDPVAPVESLDWDNITALALDSAEARVALSRTLENIGKLKDHLGK